MRKDFETADKVLPIIPKDQCTRVAHFLEKQVCALFRRFSVNWLGNKRTLILKGFKQQALLVTNDNEHKFDLAIQLGDLKIAYDIAIDADVRCRSDGIFFCLCLS